jgi:glycosyltransferase involved in cell wall biosynthesis
VTVNPVRILVVIPTYNHSRNLPELVRRVQQNCADILVVDDGSSIPVTGLPQAAIIRHQLNMGKGKAIISGAKWAQARDFTHVITMDADGQHNPQDITKFVAAIQDNPYAVIVGTRNLQQANVPISSKFGRAFSNFWLKVQTGVSLGDAQSGFRAYPLQALTQLQFTETRYSFEVEVLARAAWADFPLLSIDIDVYYFPPNERISHFAVFKDNFRISWLNTRLTFRSLLPWSHKLKFIAARKRVERVSCKQRVRLWLEQESTPCQLALSAFMGIFLSTLPLVGFHNFAIILSAGWIRFNKAFALAIGHLCIPPLAPAIAIEIGYLVRHGRLLTEISWQTLGYEFLERVWDWVVGSFILAPLLGMGIALLVWLIALGVQKKMLKDSEKNSIVVKP